MEQTITFMGRSLGADTERVGGPDVDVDVAELASLRRLPKLKSLVLDVTRATDEHLRVIAQLTCLEELDVSATCITDEGIAHLSALTNLKHLRIKDNEITDAGIRHLQALESLETLNLKALPITDAGLTYLEPLRRLKLVVLSFPEARFTRGGLERLKRQLPDCDVVVQHAPWEESDGAGGKAAT